MYNSIYFYVQKNSSLLFSYISLFCHLSHFISVHVRPGFCSVNPSLVAMLTVAGANGGSGLSVHFLVVEELSSRDASVITHPLRMEGEAALESLNSRETATHTCAQVVLSDQPSLDFSKDKKNRIVSLTLPFGNKGWFPPSGKSLPTMLLCLFIRVCFCF